MSTTLKITLPDGSTLSCVAYNVPRIGEQVAVNGQTGVVTLVRHMPMNNTVLILLGELPVSKQDVK